MSKYRDQLTAALFHSKATAHHIRKALDLLGCDADDDDDDEPVESGLAPLPPPDDIPDSGFLPALFDDELEDNPQSGSHGRFMRLVR
jgi:hypothetical protein